MCKVVHSLQVAVLALAGTVALAFGWTMPPAVQLTATALLMGPTSVPDPGQHYMNNMTRYYITPYFGVPDAKVPVHTPAQLWPFASMNPVTFDWDAMTFDQSVAGGLVELKDAVAAHPAGEPLVILGYSQSTRTASAFKRELIAQFGDDFGAYPDIGLVLVANLNKPNGGILARGAILGPIPITIPFIGITFDGATPTNSPGDPSDPADHALHTEDFAIVHDGVTDAPVYLNPLTVANAIAGFFYLHDYPPEEDSSDGVTGLVYQGSKGDTDYYVYGTDIVPILRPLASIGVPRPVLLALDEPLRVLIETTGYRRDINPGEHTPFGLFPIVNPLTLTANLLTSVPVGLDDAFEDMGAGRPFGTTPSGPFGVGGPPLPDPPPSSAPPAEIVSHAAPAEPASPPTAAPPAAAGSSLSDTGTTDAVAQLSDTKDRRKPAKSEGAQEPIQDRPSRPQLARPAATPSVEPDPDRPANEDDVTGGQRPVAPTDDAATNAASGEAEATVGGVAADAA